MNEEQVFALQYVKDGHSVYLGGHAGTGKLHAVREVVSRLNKVIKEGKNFAVNLTCTTGVACCLYPEIFGPMTVNKWSGLGEWRLTIGQLISLMDAEDDRYMAAVDRIKCVDFLIIHKISMFSKLMFEKLEAVIRHVKGNNLVFGGVQLLLVGDFLQLPPVRNAYSDPGEFCFQSDIFPSHHIFLKQVMRQKDKTFCTVVNNIALGERDDVSMTYVKELRRNLVTDRNLPTTRLFASNILADIYNRDCLLKLAGEVFQFEAVDEGKERHLATLTVQKTLWLKRNAKVMLLRNLSDQLVNVLCGSITNFREGEVDMYFPALCKMCTLKRLNFAVFDPVAHRNVAVRNQLPLKLCYAMTVHKAQGMTLDRVEVDCRQIFQPGQLAVAMGHVKSPDGLRVVNFNEDAIIPQPPLVIEFLSRKSMPVKTDASCCHYRFDGHMSVEKPEDTEFDDETDQFLAGIDIQPTELGAEIDQIEPPDETTPLQFDDDDEFLAGIVLEPPPAPPLPVEFKLQEEIRSLVFQDTTRDNQIVHNQWIDYLLDNVNTLDSFCRTQYAIVCELYSNSMKDTHTQKAQTSFFQSYQSHTTSDSYQSSVLHLMPETDRTDIVFQLAFEIMSALRELMLRKVSEGLPMGGFGNEISKRQLSSQMTDTAKGKIRYIGGYVTAKLLHHTNKTVHRCAYKSDKERIGMYESATRRMKLLHHMKCNEINIQDSHYPESLKETARKQNINRGLTNVTDTTYKFFEHLTDAILSHLTGGNLNIYGTELHQHIKESVSKEALEHFLHTVSTAAVTVDEVSFDTDIPIIGESVESCVLSCIHELSYTAEVTNELFNDILNMSIAVLFKQFSKDIVTSMNIKKNLEHRKQPANNRPPHNLNSHERKLLYRRFLAMLYNCGAWKDVRYIERKVAARRGDCTWHKRELMPECVVQQCSNWLPNPRNQPYLGHKWS